MDPWLLEKLVHYIYDLFVGYTNIYYFLALLKNGNFANLSQIAILWTVKILSADYVPGLHTIAQMSERWGGVFGCFFQWNLASKKVFNCLLLYGLNETTWSSVWNSEFTWHFHVGIHVWKSLRKNIANWCQTCQDCQPSKITGHTHPATHLHSFIFPSLIWLLVSFFVLSCWSQK